MFREGDVVAIPLPNGGEALAKILFVSGYFKNAVGFAVYGVKQAISSDDLELLHRQKPLMLYTNILAASHYGWRTVAHDSVTPEEAMLTKCIVGGEVWMGDKELRSATAHDYETLPRMLVSGMLAVYQSIANTFEG